MQATIAPSAIVKAQSVLDPDRLSPCRGCDTTISKISGARPKTAPEYPDNGLCHHMPNAVCVVPAYAKRSAT